MSFILKKFLGAVLFPPGILSILFVLSGSWLCRKRAIAAGLVNIMLGCLLWAMSTPLVANRLVQPLERGVSIPQPLVGDVIILLCGGIYEKVPDLTGQGTPSGDALWRVVTAVRAFRKIHLPIIVSGGASVRGGTPESVITGRFLKDLGVPADMVIEERQSRDTTENARNCKDILELRGFRNPILVTSGYHMKRSVQAFERVGVRVLPLPARFMTVPENTYTWMHFLPSVSAFGISATAIKEHAGFLFYRLKHWTSLPG